MAGGAGGGEAEPDGRHGRRPVDAVEHAVFLLDHAALAGADVAAVEAGGNELLLAGVRQHVARELFDGELVEWQVAVEGVDHPVAVAPDLAVVVEVDAMGVGVSCGVQPVAAALFAPLRHREQAVDVSFVSVGSDVGEVGVEHFRRRRESGEVEGHPAGKRAAVGLGRRGQAVGFELGEHEGIERLAHPVLLADFRQRVADDRLERPVALVHGAVLDPLADHRDLFLRQQLVRLRWRHDLILVVRKHALEGGAGIGVAGHDGGVAVLVRRSGRVADIEPQFRLAGLAVGTMAGEAVLGKDRADIARVAVLRPGGDRRRDDGLGRRSDGGDFPHRTV